MEEKRGGGYTPPVIPRNGWMMGSADAAENLKRERIAMREMERAAILGQEADLIREQEQTVLVAPVVPAMPPPAMPATPAVPPRQQLVPGGSSRPLAMAYLVNQEWDETYEPETGLERGTIFPELDLPFMGEGACRYE